MIVNFNSLSDDSRIWVYGSETILTETHEKIISQDLSHFLENWEYHQNKLKASFRFFKNRFIIVALDDAEFEVGGCSMDRLQRLIQEFELKLGLSLLSRLNIFCMIGDSVECYTSSELHKYASDDTLFYDLTIQKKKDLSKWLKPIKDGWCTIFIL